MDNWIVVISFIYPHEAHMAKGKLESEGMEVIIRDELTAQVNNFYSNAIGGVKLMVKEQDLDTAKQLLIESGYIKEAEPVNSKFWSWFNQFTAKLPWIGGLIVEIRLIIVVAFMLMIIILPIVISSLPTLTEKLTDNSWCVDQIYYKGQSVIPNSLGIKLESNYNNCSETMCFRENGIVDFPGINSHAERAHWDLRNDSLIITSLPADTSYTFNSNLKIAEKEGTVKQSIYLGTYHLEIKNNVIKMQSDQLLILGEVYRFNFNF